MLLSYTNRLIFIESRKGITLRFSTLVLTVVPRKIHAAREEEPLYTASERVQRAFEKVTAGKQFTVEQKKWLDRIREHLIASLSIDKSDFENIPIFSRFGGWGRANMSFNNQLENIIKDLNEAVAA